MISWSLSNIFQFFSFLAPSLIAFFLFMASVFNQDLKGFVYLAGALFATCLNRVAQSIIQTRPTNDRPAACSIFDGFPFGFGTAISTQPSTSSMFIGFTTAYLILPMYYNNQINYPIIITFFSLFMINAWTNVVNNCTPATGAILGGLIGVVCALSWFSLLNGNGLGKLLYFNEVASNKVMCEKPTEQQFKCEVYKNGKLISKDKV